MRPLNRRASDSMTLMPRSPTPNSSLSGVIMPRTMFLSISSTNRTRPSTHMGSDNRCGRRPRRRSGIVVVAVVPTSVMGGRMFALIVQPLPLGGTMGSGFDVGAIEIAEAVRSGQRRAVDVVDEALAAIDAGNERLGAFIHVDEGQARAAAEAVDAAVAAGRDPGPFAGVPIGVKDLEDCAGMPTTHGSLAYAGRGPVAADSIHVARLRAAGAVPVGKTAAPEFGTLNFTKTKVFGFARNPWDPERTPGGSSGGSAAAVAAGWIPAATASDGGGATPPPPPVF